MFNLFLHIIFSFTLVWAQEDQNDEPVYNNEEVEQAQSDEFSEEGEAFGFEDSGGTAEETAAEDDNLIEQIERLNKVNEGNFILRPYIYNERGRRDPFTPVVSNQKTLQTNKRVQTELPDLEKYRIDSFTLTSIIWSVNEPKALVKDPSNKTHLIKKNSKIGTKNGYVARIREGEIVVVEEEQDEEGKSLFTTQVLKMAR